MIVVKENKTIPTLVFVDYDPYWYKGIREEFELTGKWKIQTDGKKAELFLEVEYDNHIKSTKWFGLKSVTIKEKIKKFIHEDKFFFREKPITITYINNCNN